MPQTAAFFDVDDTLLAGNSGTLYTRYMFQNGKIRRRDFYRAAYAIVLHRMNRLDAIAVARRFLAFAVGYSLQQMKDECAQWFDEMVIPRISADGVRAIEAHRAAGHRLVLCSASTQFLCEPLQAHLSLDGSLCTQLLHQDGLLTGEVAEPFCYGPGKRIWIERYAAEHGIDLVRSYFYTDSASDLPALEAVGHPVAINADRALYREARARGWALRRWGGAAANSPPRQAPSAFAGAPAPSSVTT